MHRNLSDIDCSTVADDLRRSASFSARKNPQCLAPNTTPVFPGLRSRTWPNLLRLVTNRNVGQAPSPWQLCAGLAIVIKINSPGGTVTASDIIYHELKTFKATRKIPVVASIMDVGASGGYYIAAAA